MRRTGRLRFAVTIVSRKALFFDIDGTLLSEITRTVPESAVRALHEARNKGHLVFINTGRVICNVGELRDLIEADGYLCGCGTYVEAEGRVLYSYHIPREMGIEIKHNIRRFGLDGVLEGSEALYVQKEPSAIPELEDLKSKLTSSGMISEYGWDDDCYDYDKLFVFEGEDCDRAGFFRSLGLDIDVIDRGGGSYECVPIGHSKGTAIELIQKEYQIPLKDVYVFGDSTNDLPMFEYAQNAILMGHHDKELEPFASMITKNVEQDGIEYALKKLGII